jgi:hypothetical protein
MHIITFIIFYTMWLFTLINRIIIGYHTCILWLEFRKHWIIYFTSWSFWHWSIRWFWFRRLFYTLGLHFWLGYYTYFVLWSTICLGLSYHILLNIILHFLIPIWRLLNCEFSTYYFLVWRWILISKYWFHILILFLGNR